MELKDFLKIICNFIFNFFTLVSIRSHSLKIYFRPVLNTSMVEVSLSFICTRLVSLIWNVYLFTWTIFVCNSFVSVMCCNSKFYVNFILEIRKWKWRILQFKKCIWSKCFFKTLFRWKIVKITRPTILWNLIKYQLNRMY